MSKCNAPCIINTAIGFQLVLCEQEHSHDGNHTSQMRGSKERLIGSKEATVSWTYTGQPCDGGESGAPSLHERCDSWTRVNQPRQLAPGILEPMYRMSLMTVTEATAAITGFCCEKSPGHEGGHMRSGVFGPEGIKWAIEW